VALDSDEQLKVKQLLDSRFFESASPSIGNVAIFYDEQDTMTYAGIIENWPIIITTDIEWGRVEEKDATQEPFAGKKVKFFSLLE
jgi:hypothetical protein